VTVYKDFLDAIWGEQEGWADIARMSEGDLKNHKFFEWPSQREDVFAYIERYKLEDVYFTPVLFKSPQRRRSAAKTAQVVYGDADLFPVDDLYATPSIIVRTSPEKTHVYWSVTDTHDVPELEGMAHSVSLEHPKDKTGYDNGWSATKLLRVPGTKNLKYADNAFDVTVEYTGEIYTSAQFQEHYALVPDVIFDPKPFPEEDMPSYSKALSSIPSSTTLEDLLRRRFNKGGSGSEALYLLYNELFRLGATDEATYVIAEKSPLNKWRRDNVANASKLLWDDVQRARAKFGSPVEGDERDDMDEDVTITVAPKPKKEAVDFLTQYEKDNLPKTFVDDYLAWATSKTDAAQEYHVAGAFTILSTVFADFGHALPKWGPEPLNLWFMVLGSTTLSRKSTTKRLMLSVIEKLEDENYTYDLGSKFTAEGLDEALRRNANRSALLHRDEIQSFMKEADAKPYLQGVKGELTELYDGKVSGKLRASGDKNDQVRKGSRVAMVLFTMGIRDQLAEYLTLDDFQSGFLTRFIYVVGDAPKRTAETDYVEQGDANAARLGDPVFDGIIERLEAAREHWESWADPTEATIPVKCTPEAWERWNKFITAALDAAECVEKRSVVEAAASRLSNSILKCATLLAMWDMCDEVDLKHMLAAINYCGSWFKHMVDMANSISANGWKRRQDKLAGFIMEHGGEVNWKAAYRHFKAELKPREFFDLVAALEEAGQVTIRNEKNGSKFISATEVL
jgi:Protein of unknown function (DUF3987)